MPLTVTRNMTGIEEGSNICKVEVMYESFSD